MLSISTYLLLIFVIVNCFVLLPVKAQINSNSLTRLAVEDGLSQASVLSITQDEKGYLWVGTINGINIYDGYTISPVLGPDNDFNKYPTNCLYVSSDGLIWISIFGKGLYSYNPISNEYRLILKHKKNDKNSTIWKVVEDTEHHLYWFMSERNVYKFDTKTKRIIDTLNFSEQLTSKGIILSIKLLNNRLLVTSSNGMFFYDRKKEQLHKLPDINIKNDISTSKNDNTNNIKIYDLLFLKQTYYIGTNHGVYSFSESELSQYLDNQQQNINYKTVIEEAEVFQLALTKNYLYVATSLGLYRFNITDNKDEFLFNFSEHFNKTSDKSIISLLVDQSGKIWLGAESSGLYLWDPNKKNIKNYIYDNKVSNSLSNSNVNTIIAEDQSRLWVGTSNGLNLIDIKKDTVETYIVDPLLKDLFTKNKIYRIEKDYLGKLWLVTANDIHIFDPKKKKLITPTYPKNTLKTLASGNKWVSISRVKEYMWANIDNTIYRIHAKTGEMSKLDNITEFFKDKDKDIWRIMESFTEVPDDLLIACNDTLWLYNQSTKQLSKIYQLEHSGVTTDSYIDHWVRDEKGLIWFSYAMVGIIAIDPKTYEVKHFYNKKNSIIDENIFGIQLDSKNNIWVASVTGLYNLNTSTHHIRYFNKSDGLATSVFNPLAFYKFSDGKFTYGGVEGLSIFDPLDLADDGYKDDNHVSIVNISTLSRKLNLPNIIPNNYHVDLKYDDFGISINFSNFLFTQGAKPTFKYSLVGNGSFPETKQNHVTFSHLESGDYTFKVQVKSIITGEYSAPVFVHLHVSYAPMQSPLAYTLYIIIVLVFIALWLRNKQRREAELLEAHRQLQNREKRLELALSAGNSEVWDWLANEDVFIAKRYTEELYYQVADTTSTFCNHLDVIHPKDKEIFITKWHAFLNNKDANNSFECTYRLKSNDHKWLWYRDVGKIVAYDDNGIPTKVTGLYNNITEEKGLQERALCYGAAFEQTHDWVFIFDDTFEVARANKSMANVFHWEDTELDLYKGLNGFNIERLEYYLSLLPTIEKKGYWLGEEIITTPDGHEYHVLINITFNENIEHDKKHLICVFTDITTQKSAEKELRILANYDHLTGLPNRSLLLDRLEQAISASERSHKPVALFFIDLDKFKQVNDTLGHECGDILLTEVSERLTSILRKEDTLARFGGDEFVVLLGSYRCHDDLAPIAKKIIDASKVSFNLKGNIANIGSSIGIAVYPANAETLDELVRNADIAMYHAKETGRNNFKFYKKNIDIEDD